MEASNLTHTWHGHLLVSEGQYDYQRVQTKMDKDNTRSDDTLKGGSTVGDPSGRHSAGIVGIKDGSSE